MSCMVQAAAIPYVQFTVGLHIYSTHLQFIYSTNYSIRQKQT